MNEKALKQIYIKTGDTKVQLLNPLFTLVLIKANRPMLKSAFMSWFEILGFLVWFRRPSFLIVFQMSAGTAVAQ